VLHNGENVKACRVLVGKRKRRQVGRPELDEKIILKWMLKK
jgi:hypothetical protein